MSNSTVSARISPAAGMDVLSRNEVTRLRDATLGGLHALLRRCALAVLISGGTTDDDPRSIFERYPDFDIQVLQQDRGIKLELTQRAGAARSSKARSSAASTNCCSRWCATSSTSPRRSTRVVSISTIHTASPTPCSKSCATRACCSRTSNPTWSCAGAAIRSRAHGIRVHQARRLPARPARPRHLHRLRPGRDEGADEGRDDRARQAASAFQALHRHHRAGHHRGRIAEPDRQQSRHHAGHREAPRSVRAHRPRHHRVSRAASARPRKSSICSASCCIRTMRPCRSRWCSPDRRNRRRTSSRSTSSCASRSATRSRSITASSIDDPAETARVDRTRASRRCASTASTARTRFSSTGRCISNMQFQQPFRPTHANMAALNLQRDQPAHLLAADLRRAFSGIVAGNVKEEGMQRDRRARAVRDRRRSGNHARAGQDARELRRAASHEIAGHDDVCAVLSRQDLTNAIASR